MTKKRLKLTTSRDIRHAINRVANLLLNGELEPRVAHELLYACNAALSAVRIDDQESRLRDLEKLVEELEGQYRVS